MSMFSFSSSSTDAQVQPFKGERIDPDVTSGHLNHLTPDQQAAFAVFKDTLAKAQLYSPERPHPTHDEPTLLRFLRARRFDPHKAHKQFADAEAWRKKHNVDALYATFPVDEFESARRFYPRWTGRRDKNGLPVYVSLPALWQLRAHLQEASALATANYPETLSTIAVVNSPAFFPTVWGWIKPWFDEGTRRKVHVLGRDPGPTLRTLIDPKDLPKPYGGELDWKFEDEPALDDAAKAVIGEMPKGPVVFENGEVRRPAPPEPADTDSASQ
ncbi:CRAL/TRIO domain-containing protein [Trametes sanguinea]|nr:CRAL/TRIO domain-containing protein [Trametes sanguinea]